MHKIVVFGNSGSGKSTYALDQVENLGCVHLDLDTIAWQADAVVPTRRPLSESQEEIHCFVETHEQWVVEGCYADLLEFVLFYANELVFLNPGAETCVQNARNRPWEPHKYSSPEAQAATLEKLVDWIRQYDQREDEYSLMAHRRLFENFSGKKREFRSNARD